MTAPINYAYTRECEFGADCAAPGTKHLKPIPAPVPRSPVIIEIDWTRQMDELNRRDEERQQAALQDAWIREYRAKMFRNVLGGK